MDWLYWTGSIIGTYIGIGLLFTSGVYLYHRLTNRFTGGGFFDGVLPTWLVFIVAVVVFPINIYLHIINWQWSRAEKQRLKDYMKTQGWN